jgi:hypothetical protein
MAKNEIRTGDGYEIDANGTLQSNLTRTVREVYDNVRGYNDSVKKKWSELPESARGEGALLATSGIKNMFSPTTTTTTTTTTARSDFDNVGIRYTARKDESLMVCLKYYSDCETGPSQIRAMENAFCEMVGDKINAEREKWKLILVREYEAYEEDCNNTIDDFMFAVLDNRKFCQIWKCQDPRVNGSRCDESCNVSASCGRHAISNRIYVTSGTPVAKFPIFLHVDLNFFDNDDRATGPTKKKNEAQKTENKTCAFLRTTLQEVCAHYKWMVLIGLLVGFFIF